MRIDTSIMMVGIALTALGGCERQRHYQTSLSVDDSRERGLLIAEYQPTGDADLGRYEVAEVWVENHADSLHRQLMVRLRGPHHDGSPRVNVVGDDQLQYVSIWSRRDGPPYEVWTAPDSLPKRLTLEREDKRVSVVRLSQ